MNPSAMFAALLGLVGTALLFLLALFLKLCYSTALYATLAEITRRLNLFRAATRPPARAILLVPAVVGFCTAILVLLYGPGLLFGAGEIELAPITLLWAVGRLVLLGVFAAAGLLTGWLVGARIPMGRDRYGAVTIRNRGRYLVFWMAAFSVAGFFRLMPWGFASIWIVGGVIMAAAWVTSAHLRLYVRYRHRRQTAGGGLPAGAPLDLSLSPAETLVLGALTRSDRPLSPTEILAHLAMGDPAQIAHPAWQAEATRLAGTGPDAVQPVLSELARRGLVSNRAGVWQGEGATRRLAAFGQADGAAALTCAEEGGSHTRVLLWSGPSRLLLEPGPDTLTIREARSDECLAATLLG